MKSKAVKSPNRVNILVGITLVLLLAIAGVAYMLLSNIDTLKLKEPTFQHRIAMRFDYPESAKLQKDADGVYVVYGNQKLLSDEFPIYTADRTKIFLPKDMSLVIPMSELRSYRLPYFSAVEVDELLVNVSRGNKYASVDNSFIYNGADTYIFLEPMTLVVGEEIIELGRFSTVLALHNILIEVYDTTTDTYRRIETGISEVSAKAPSGYEINLGTDTVISKGSQYMLISKPELLGDFLEQ